MVSVDVPLVSVAFTLADTPVWVETELIAAAREIALASLLLLEVVVFEKESSDALAAGISIPLIFKSPF